MTKWRVMFVIGLCYLVTVSSTALTVLLLSPIAEHHGVSLAAVGWVVIIEGLVIAALLLPLGGLADGFGRRRILIGGLGFFGLGAVAVGLAPTFALLIGARLVMAVGNTMIQAVGTGLLVAAFPPHERGIAMGGQTSSVAIGGATGPLLGGYLLRSVEWTSLFVLLAVPVAVTIATALAFLPDDRNETAQRRFTDYVGALLSAGAVVVLILTISNPFKAALLSPLTIGGALLALVLAGSFVGWELRSSLPMLQLKLFTNPTFRIAVMTRVSGFLASAPFTILLPIYLLSVRDVSTTMAGLVLALRAVGQGISAQFAGRLYDRVGPRRPTIVGFLLQAVCIVGLILASTTTTVVAVAIFAAGFGFGQSLWNVPNNSAMMGATSRSTLGVVGAFTNVARTIGTVVGQATAAAVVAGVMVRRGFDIPLADITELTGAIDAFLAGWNVAFIVALVITGIGCLVGTRLPHGRPEAQASAGGSRSVNTDRI